LHNTLPTDFYPPTRDDRAIVIAARLIECVVGEVAMLTRVLLTLVILGLAVLATLPPGIS
jgi:hypothetical protein